MPTANDTIAHALTVAHTLLKRYVADLGPQEYLHRPSPTANCAAWIVGHLTVSERSGLTRLGAPLPELPEGFEHRFSREEGCPQAEDFGDVTKLMPLFDEHRNRLIAAVRSATPEQLDQPLEKPHPLFNTVGEFLIFYSLHGAMHAGQITMIRRSLGRPPLV